MKKKSYIFAAAGLFIVLLILTVFIILQIFTVRDVEVMMDFKMEKQRFLTLLGIQNKRFIWDYNIPELKKKLEEQVFIDEYEVQKHYPGRVIFIIKKRKALATVSGKDGNIFYIDRRGLVFSRVLLPVAPEKMVPHLIVRGQQKKIVKGAKIGGKYSEVISLLHRLRRTEKTLYDSLSQVEVWGIKGGSMGYAVNYKTINKRLYLKKQISVEIIKKGLCTALFLQSTGSKVSTFFYSAIGFYY